MREDDLYIFNFSVDSSSEQAVPPPPLTQLTFGAGSTGSTNETESTISSLETLEEAQAQRDSHLLQVGDHVYTWCSLLGVRRAYQHHGIVVHVSNTHIKIIDFYPLLAHDDDDDKAAGGGGGKSSSGAFSSSGSGGSKNNKAMKGRRAFTMSEVILDHITAHREWKRVDYSVAWTERFIRSPGTCSTVTADHLGFVMSRIEFLHENGRHILPPYDELLSNCECVAVWCKTGTYSSLQGTALLGVLSGTSLKATALAGFRASAATTTVTVPAAGLWGWIGFTTTTTVALTTAAPLLMPAIVAAGAVTTIPPMLHLHRCKQEWKTTTETLNDCLAQACRHGQFLPHLPRFHVMEEQQ